MTAEERAAREERQRFIDKVVADACRRAGIENTREGRGRYIEEVLGRLQPRSSS